MLRPARCISPRPARIAKEPRRSPTTESPIRAHSRFNPHPANRPHALLPIIPRKTARGQCASPQCPRHAPAPSGALIPLQAVIEKPCSRYPALYFTERKERRTGIELRRPALIRRPIRRTNHANANARRTMRKPTASLAMPPPRPARSFAYCAIIALPCGAFRASSAARR